MPDYQIKGKYFLAKEKEKLLFDGHCVVTEKIDGANTSISKVDGKVQLCRKLGPIDYSHPQFSFFQNQWYYNNLHKLEQLPNNIILYGELMRCIHTIKYDKLPDWWIVFAGYDLKKELYISYQRVETICHTANLSIVPLIYSGKINKEILSKLMPLKSKFGNVAEGMAIFNYENQVFGKYVKPEFVKAVENSKFWKDKKIELNGVV